MITDEQAKLSRQRRMDGKTLATAAAASGMSERTARKWQSDPLPSQSAAPRAWRTRKDVFEDVWQTDFAPMRVTILGCNHLPISLYRLRRYSVAWKPYTKTEVENKRLLLEPSNFAIEADGARVRGRLRFSSDIGRCFAPEELETDELRLLLGCSQSVRRTACSTLVRGRFPCFTK